MEPPDRATPTRTATNALIRFITRAYGVDRARSPARGSLPNTRPGEGPLPRVCYVDIYGWVHFNDPERAERAQESLEAEGYRVELQHQDEGAAVVLAIPPEPSLPSEALTTRLRSLADDFGGEFIGHGGSEQVVLRDRS